jgi:hypothetical protein
MVHQGPLIGRIIPDCSGRLSDPLGAADESVTRFIHESRELACVAGHNRVNTINRKTNLDTDTLLESASGQFNPDSPRMFPAQCREVRGQFVSLHLQRRDAVVPGMRRLGGHLPLAQVATSRYVTS